MMTDQSWKPVAGQMMTPWAEEVDSTCPLPEYPRPMMVRQRWLNLNGLWEYAIQARDAQTFGAPHGKLLVPFPIESALSGVKQALLPTQRLWYRRSFQIPPEWSGSRLFLRFGAVDFEAEVWVNQTRIGDHRGGFLPFEFEITPALVPGENTLTVAVWDPTDTGLQERGKQVLNPRGIWYTAVSGIWQTVWLEPVAPLGGIRMIRVTPDFDQSQVRIEVDLLDTGSEYRVRARGWDATGEVSAQGMAGEPLVLTVPQPHSWTPADPHLYNLEVSVWEGDQVLDTVESYFGMRKIHMAPGPDGHQRIFLNNRPIFLYGPLDQGYFPDGLYTPPSEEAMCFDIDAAKRLGFNFIRKHVKVEPQRWYTYCDQVGMLVWQDMPNGGKEINDLTSILAMHFHLNLRDDTFLGRFGRGNSVNRGQYRNDLKGMVDSLYNHPSIIVWVPFNEGWGQFRSKEAAGWLKSYDGTRLVDAVSGWFDQGAGDFCSRHQYVLKLYAPRKTGSRAFVLSEIGGYSRVPVGNAWNEAKKFGYRFFDTPEELTEAYLDLLQDQMEHLVRNGLAAAVYTELCDTEIEVNGFLTYDRRVEKMDFGRLAETHRRITAWFPEL